MHHELSPAPSLRILHSEQKGRKQVEVVSPVVPGMEAVAFVLLCFDSCLIKYGDRGVTVFESYVVLAGADPEQPKRPAVGAVLPHDRVFLLLDDVREPAGAENTDVREVG